LSDRRLAGSLQGELGRPVENAVIEAVKEAAIPGLSRYMGVQSSNPI
jgi:hypothetical protein